MGKKKKVKVKKKCCEKYLKSGKHCKGCPLIAKVKPAKEEKKAAKKKVAKKKKEDTRKKKQKDKKKKAAKK